MKILIIYGLHETGKTTVIEEVGKGLVSRGFSFSTIKDIHCPNFEPDTKGTDTYRHVQSGSQLTVAWGPKDTSIIYPKKIDFPDVLPLIHTDFLLIEGNINIYAPKILCLKDLEELSLIDPLVIALSGIITKSDQLKFVKSLPHPLLNPFTDREKLVEVVLKKSFEALPYPPPQNCQRCGSSCQEFSVKILEGKNLRENCPL